MRNDLPQTVKILAREEHGARAVSLTLPFACDFTPGQFVMAWMPGVDEKPFSISRHQAGTIELTIKRLGPVSSRLADLPVGAQVGLRGPYGHGFSAVPGCCFVAGGVGLAALAPLIEQFPNATVLYGENAAEDLMLTERFPHMRLFTCDGSQGRQGFPTDALPAVLDTLKPTMVYSCGPEIMMTKVASICRDKDTPCQVSLERYMKCAVGVCGQCCMDGRRVCVDGPVFDGDQLIDAVDFGFRHLDKSGTWIHQPS